MYDIDLNEVLRYLGYKNNMTVDKDLIQRTEEIAQMCKNEVSPLYTYAFFDIEKGESIKVSGTDILLCGADIRKHLENSERCALLSSTLGSVAEQKLLFWQKKSMTDAIIFDACCDSLIENVTDRAEEEIRNLAENEGYKLTTRYSPGYGDLALDIQKNILSVLSADKRIGLSVTETNILLPRKSITAVIGLERRKP